MPRQQTPPGSISSHKTNFTLSIYEKFAAKSKFTEFGMGRNQLRLHRPRATRQRTARGVLVQAEDDQLVLSCEALHEASRPPSISSYRAKVTNDSMTFRGSSGLPSRGAGRSITPPRSISSHRRPSQMRAWA